MQILHGREGQIHVEPIQNWIVLYTYPWGKNKMSMQLVEI